MMKIQPSSIDTTKPWIVSRQLQLLHILEGVPAEVSHLNHEKYNKQSIYFFTRLNNQHLVELFSEQEPGSVNLRLYDLITVLYEEGKMSEDEFRDLMAVYAHLIVISHGKMNQVWGPIHRCVLVALHKYRKLNPDGGDDD